jgi:hypothetical protein
VVAADADDPTATEAAIGVTVDTTPDPHFDVGQLIVVGDDGVAPAWLVGQVGVPVTWSNVTDQRRRLTIDHHPGLGGWIDAGGTFSYTPETLISFRYHLSGEPRLTGAFEASADTGGAP